MPTAIAEGDLVELAQQGCFDLVANPLDCRHGFDTEVARAIERAWPQVSDYDRSTPPLATKLGNARFIEVTTAADGILTIANLYVQVRPGPDVDSTGFSYDALTESMQDLAYSYPIHRIGYSIVGVGIDGVDLHRCQTLIDRALENCDHTLVVPEDEL